MSEFSLELSHQIPLTGALLAPHLVLYHLAQVGYCLGIPSGVYIIVGIGVVPFLHGAPVERVALDFCYHVFGIINPAFLDIAFCEPCPCSAVDGGLGGVEAAHVGKCRRSLVERAFHKLRASHQHPRLPQEGVILLAVKPLDVFLRLLAAFCPLRPFLYAVQLYCLLTFLYSTVEVALAQLAAVLVADGVERYHLGEVVLVAVLFL